MRSTATLAWRNLTGHPLRSVLTALAIALGVAMVLASSIVGQAASQSADTLDNAGPGIALEVISRRGNQFDQACTQLGSGPSTFSLCIAASAVMRDDGSAPTAQAPRAAIAMAS